MKNTHFFKSLQLGILLGIFFGADAQNLITNGSFENGTTDWINLAGDSGVATYSVTDVDASAGTNSLQVVVNTLGSNSWSIQSLHATTTITTGQPYTFTFYAKAATTGASVNVVIQNASYLAQSFALTSSWAKYEWNFTAAEDSPQLRLQYSQIGTYYIDDVQLVGPATTETLNIAVSPATSYQTMVGFGGGITWYCDLITKSAKKSEIIDLMFKDAGTDIIRFKNWYYPSGYPTTKATDNMEQSYFKGHFDATNQLYTLAKQSNPNVEVLLSSWTPPIALKSNGAQEEGTLKKNNGQFMYNELGQYYKDVLDSITFNPDYFSFQNEPGFSSTDWGTCEWRPTETTDFPGYDQGLDAVYNAISSRAYVPKLLGPETENIGTASWDNAVNTFTSMATPIATKPYLYGYAYHLYNFGGAPGNVSANTLNMLKNEFGTKPNFMTEFSSANFDWLQTADAIHQTVVEANAAAYIYWELTWDTSAATAMIQLDNSGNYKVNSQFYTLKHFAKFVDKGYQRIAVAGGNSTIKISGYLNPAGNQITLVALNNGVTTQGTKLGFGDYTVASAAGYQSVDSNFYQDLGALDLTQEQSLPAKSLTTFVVNLNGTVTGLNDSPIASDGFVAYPNPFENTIAIEVKGSFSYQLLNLSGVSLETGLGQDHTRIGATLPKGLYVLKISQNNTNKVLKIQKY